MQRTFRTLVALLFVMVGVFSLANCANDNAVEAVQNASVGAATSSPAPEIKTAPVSPITAGRYTAVLKARIPSISKVYTWNEETDPNKLLGRPNGYTSATYMIDTRAACETTMNVQCGADVEVFASNEAAESRRAYIAGILKEMPMLGTEYHYIKENMLVRVSGLLTPAQAKEYQP